MKNNSYCFYLIILVCMLSCQSHTAVTTKLPTLTAAADSIGSIVFSISSKTGNRIAYINTKIDVAYISTTLYNPNDDTITFLSMACSYEEFFQTNSNRFVVQSPFNCYTNFPCKVTIPPKDSFKLFKIMVSDNLSDTLSKSYTGKIGMQYIVTKKDDDIFKLYDKRHIIKGDIIWSNEIDFSKLLK